MIELKDAYMFKIFLINMPFAELNVPSLALSYLKSVIGSTFGQQVSTKIFYLNHDFAHYIGGKLYRYISHLQEYELISGLSDWFFRQVAFPKQSDNTEEYFHLFYPRKNRKDEIFKKVIQEKKQGLEVFLEELISKYELNKAELVGFTSGGTQTVANIAMARDLKKTNPNIITVMGGPNCEVPMGQEIIKNVKHIDFIFSGPSLKSFPEFVQCCLNDKKDKCHKIKGVFSKRNFDVLFNQGVDEKIKHKDIIGEELDINADISLDYWPFLNSLANSFPDKTITPKLLFETSRGCWWGERSKCMFCGLNGLSLDYRAMKPKRAIQQIQSLFKYASRCSKFIAADRIMPKNYPKEVFPFLDIPRNVKIFYATKSNLSEEDLQYISKAGKIAIQPGIEALATSVLNLMNKGTTAFQNIRLLMNCVMYNVPTKWNLLLGFPRESEDVYEKYIHDIPLLVHLPPPRIVFRIQFSRYSDYFVKATEYGLNLQPYDYYEMTYPFDNHALVNFAHWFMDCNQVAKYAKYREKWIGRIKDKCDYWNIRWRGKDQLPPAKLFLKTKGKSTMIYDSRSGKVIEHEISEIGKSILEHLIKPQHISDIANRLEHIQESRLCEEVRLLKKLGLLFQEQEHFMSLVLSKEPKDSFSHVEDYGNE